VRAALKERYAVVRRDAEADAERLQAEHKRLEDRIHTMYLDKLDGRITTEFFDVQAAECRAQQERIRRVHMEQSKAASDGYLDLGVRLLDLARRAPDLFRRSTAAEKRLLLGFVLSNSTLTDGRLSVEYRQPFDLLADAVRHERSLPVAAGAESARSAIWGG
jgi:site-specific DNA recombinase